MPGAAPLKSVYVIFAIGYVAMYSMFKLWGRPLLPPFAVEVINHSGKSVLKYCHESDCTERACEVDLGEPSRRNSLTARFMMRRAGGWEQVILNTLLGNVEDYSDNDSNEMVD
ncbi:hypothetical protein IFM89_030055 [Coptis chinensis]|uniref:Uncharacterized protein n=1 Tax=Coptis chinensis TaxID=261450 RepID=A0A835IT49_9MAGN|nr:hypothetical protein IFM89_030055 [Coptis chinensis]